LPASFLSVPNFAFNAAPAQTSAPAATSSTTQGTGATS
jgi:hypothetical protein